MERQAFIAESIHPGPLNVVNRALALYADVTHITDARRIAFHDDDGQALPGHVLRTAATRAAHRRPIHHVDSATRVRLFTVTSSEPPRLAQATAVRSSTSTQPDCPPNL